MKWIMYVWVYTKLGWMEISDEEFLTCGSIKELNQFREATHHDTFRVNILNNNMSPV